MNLSHTYWRDLLIPPEPPIMKVDDMTCPLVKPGNPLQTKDCPLSCLFQKGQTYNPEPSKRQILPNLSDSSVYAPRSRNRNITRVQLLRYVKELRR